MKNKDPFLVKKSGPIAGEKPEPNLVKNHGVLLEGLLQEDILQDSGARAVPRRPPPKTPSHI